MSLIPLEYEPYDHFNVTYLHMIRFRSPGHAHTSSVARIFPLDRNCPAPKNERSDGWLAEQPVMGGFPPWFL